MRRLRWICAVGHTTWRFVSDPAPALGTNPRLHEGVCRLCGLPFKSAYAARKTCGKKACQRANERRRWRARVLAGKA